LFNSGVFSLGEELFNLAWLSDFLEKETPGDWGAISDPDTSFFSVKLESWNFDCIMGDYSGLLFKNNVPTVIRLSPC
jgi:hypothetical protein